MSQFPTIFDTGLIARHLARRPQGSDFVTDLVIADMQDRLGALIRDFPKALIIGPDVDRLPAFGQTASASFAFERLPAFRADQADELPEILDKDYNLIVSLLHLQAVNDVPGYLARLRARLAPDGLLLIATLGGNTLTELREAFLAADAMILGGANARVAPMLQVRDGGALLQRAGLALPVADVETYTVRYDSLFALMRDLRSFGMTNMLAGRSRKPVSRQFFIEAAQLYAARHGDPDGRIRATFSIIYLSGWAPHESQPKPLKPGSATVRLADALKAPKN